ncbi:MAG: DUF5317 domain-containing protein [Alicyclobacillus macrosporangiidus]|nr:DUF5317 domain-containing protein [Alicyclobacillus macrosporangiidus]
MAFQVLTIFSGMLIGWFRRGSLWSIPYVSLRLVWILPLAYLSQVVSIHHLWGVWYELLLVFSYILLIIFCGINIQAPGVIWAMAGTIANLAVMLCNGLRMPAYIPAVQKMNAALVPLLEEGTYGKSVAMSTHTHLNFLGDIFYFDVPPGSLISIGDILIAIGIVIFIQHAMRSERRVRSSGDGQPSTTQ